MSPTTKRIIDSGWEWLWNQGVSTVMLALILYGGWSVADYAVDTAIPAHLRQIREGYEAMQERHDADTERRDALHAETIKQVMDACEKYQDRVERLSARN